MNESDLEAIGAWVVEGGLGGMLEAELLAGFCERCRGTGLELSGAIAVIDTLHPVYEGRAFRWRSDGRDESRVVEFGSTKDGAAAADWQRSAFYHLVTTGADEVRRRIGFGDPTDFLHLDTMSAEGETDYVALVHRFASAGVIGEMDCFYSSWTTMGPDGFGDTDLAVLRRLVPQLALAIKCASLARIAGTLVDVYLGRDAGQRVLRGRISRGVADRINAVLWFSDLRGYTAITETLVPEEIIPLLNDYADAVISAIHEAGGNVLKLMGDGTLAIFEADDPAAGCRSALRAEAELRRHVQALNERRTAEGRPVTSVYLGLHVGDVFYGNIGSEDRLDFTVVGPAVNEVSRIASLCRSVDRGVVLSSQFAAATPEPERAALVSLGRYALRGVARPQELFTLESSAPLP
ncbi:MAG: adenylate cyclase [Candidatus Binatota bacterium]|nr:adenylate cyclase [Candidatus Binatota bacterium]